VPFVGPVSPLAVPIFASSTWVLDSADHGALLSDRFSDRFDRTHNTVEGGLSPWLYSRWDNPTSDVAATLITRLESAHKTFLVGPVSCVVLCDVCVVSCCSVYECVSDPRP
jgi:O-acetylhomoserine/O-acetylserine sulfhydrylase-like pyridoxal-dependent enzyme